MIINMMYLFLFFTFFPLPILSANEIYQIPSDIHTIFQKSYGTGSHYILFEPNGLFKEIDKTDTFIKRDDFGAWHQQKDGILLLISRTKQRDIVGESLSINVKDNMKDEDKQRIFAIRDSVNKFLSNNSKKEFTRSEIEKISEYRVDASLSFSNIFINGGVKIIERSELERFVLIMDAYLLSSDKHIIRFKPTIHNSETFLVGIDSYSEFSRNEKLIIKEIERTPKPFPGVYLKIRYGRYKQVIRFFKSTWNIDR